MKLRIVLLLDSLDVPAWVYETVRQVCQEPNVELVLAVLNRNPLPSGTKSPFWYRVYRFLDRKIFRIGPDAFVKKNLSSLPQWSVPELWVSPIQKKYSDYFDEQTLDQIKAYQPDVILRLGFRILRGVILTLPPLGVWSYHHGDSQAFKGGPPCFWEVMNQAETTSVVLQLLSEKLDAGKILYQSTLQTDPLSVQRNANKVFWLSTTFMARVIRQVQEVGIENWKAKMLSQANPDSENSILRKPPSSWKMLGLWAVLWGRNSLRKLQEAFKKPYWELTIAPKGEQWPFGEQFVSMGLSMPLLGKGSFLADPFPLQKEGMTWVFYEDFEGKTQKGRIGVGIWDGQFLSERKVILEEDWHLSYPFIWEENGETFLIPESGEAGQTYWYKAKEFPYSWERLGVFFPKEGYDPTLYKLGEVYWLLINEKPHSGTSPFVELNGYWCKDLQHPAWIPHPQNPLVSDVRSARPAGKIFEHQGKLYRPAQDSGKRYGHRIKIQEIRKWTTSEYEEETVEIIEPEVNRGMLGTHTWNRAGDWVFSDAFYRK